MLLDEVRGGEHAIDFLHPRKPPQPKNRRRPLAMAGALIAAVPTLLIYIVLGRFFIRGLLAGSVKG
jgi:hypothetical protein